MRQCSEGEIRRPDRRIKQIPRSQDFECQECLGQVVYAMPYQASGVPGAPGSQARGVRRERHGRNQNWAGLLGQSIGSTALGLRRCACSCLPTSSRAVEVSITHCISPLLAPCYIGTTSCRDPLRHARHNFDSRARDRASGTPELGAFELDHGSVVFSLCTPTCQRPLSTMHLAPCTWHCLPSRSHGHQSAS